ncbi:AAA family ATPase [Nonomuraea sp. NBC_00507]|uniref:ATP-binding protein n=1 Tax=Nonomuraea sp. NBC_00507 TaxID=2976002 RepID=UPI002E18C8A0
MELHGRSAEVAAIDRLLLDARAGLSSSLILRGEPGIGKTALLEHAAGTAQGMQVVRGSGIESEVELPFAGLHLLLRGALDKLPNLPEPQRQALESAFGLRPAVPADRMLVGLSVLSLLSELAEDRPLLCLIDDAQWLDRPSAEALLFATRRLDAESVAVIFAARDGERPFPAPGIAAIRLTGLAAEDAAALLDEHAPALAPDVRARALGEAGGNPLALIELPIALDGNTSSGLLPLTSRLRAAFHGQVARLPEVTQRLLLVAAADDTGNLTILLEAARETVGALQPAMEAELIRLDQHARTLRFRHPLVRAAVYQEASLDQRLAAHRALADALVGSDRADRRAWHLAAAVTGQDEDAAVELERAAVQAGERNGHAAAAAAYERAAQLTKEPAERARLLTCAAEAATEAGELAWSSDLAERARPGASDPLLGSRLVRVLASAHAGQGSFRAANALLAEEISQSPQRTMEILMEMVANAWFAGDGELISQAAERLDAVRLHADDPLVPLHQIQNWIISLSVGRPTEHLPPMAEVITAARRNHVGRPHDLLHFCGLGLIAGVDTQAHDLAAEVVADSRAMGRVGLLPQALYHLAISQVQLGRYRDAATSAGEAVRIARDIGQRPWLSLASSVLAYLAAVEGDEERCRAAAADARTDAGARIYSPGIHRAGWALGLLDLAHSRPEPALRHLETVAESPARYQLPGRHSVPDLVEVAVRLGLPERASAAHRRLEALNQQVGKPSVGALVERCRALLAPDEHADDHYRAALRLHQQDSRAFEHARTELLYGEWLRRARRKAEARGHLRAAAEMFDRINARPWGERARSELNATGLTLNRRSQPGLLSRLTPQELQIVQLAARGLSNRDIAAQLLISPRTVSHHLYNAFPKLDVASRRELATLPSTGQTPTNRP